MPHGNNIYSNADIFCLLTVKVTALLATFCRNLRPELGSLSKLYHFITYLFDSDAVYAVGCVI